MVMKYDRSVNMVFITYYHDQRDEIAIIPFYAYYYHSNLSNNKYYNEMLIYMQAARLIDLKTLNEKKIEIKNPSWFGIRTRIIMRFFNAIKKALLYTVNFQLYMSMLIIIYNFKKRSMHALIAYKIQPDEVYHIERDFFPLLIIQYLIKKLRNPYKNPSYLNYCERMILLLLLITNNETDTYLVSLNNSDIIRLLSFINNNDEEQKEIRDVITKLVSYYTNNTLPSIKPDGTQEGGGGGGAEWKQFQILCRYCDEFIDDGFLANFININEMLSHLFASDYAVRSNIDDILYLTNIKTYIHNEKDNNKKQQERKDEIEIEQLEPDEKEMVSFQSFYSVLNPYDVNSNERISKPYSSLKYELHMLNLGYNESVSIIPPWKPRLLVRKYRHPNVIKEKTTTTTTQISTKSKKQGFIDDIRITFNEKIQIISESIIMIIDKIYNFERRVNLKEILTIGKEGVLNINETDNVLQLLSPDVPTQNLTEDNKNSLVKIFGDNIKMTVYLLYKVVDEYSERKRTTNPHITMMPYIEIIPDLFQLKVIGLPGGVVPTHLDDYEFWNIITEHLVYYMEKERILGGPIINGREYIQIFRLLEIIKGIHNLFTTTFVKENAKDINDQIIRQIIYNVLIVLDSDRKNDLVNLLYLNRLYK